jgi:hypothetical protein
MVYLWDNASMNLEMAHCHDANGNLRRIFDWSGCVHPGVTKGYARNTYHGLRNGWVASLGAELQSRPLYDTVFTTLRNLLDAPAPGGVRFRDRVELGDAPGYSLSTLVTTTLTSSTQSSAFSVSGVTIDAVEGAIPQAASLMNPAMPASGYNMYSVDCTEWRSKEHLIDRGLSLSKLCKYNNYQFQGGAWANYHLNHSAAGDLVLRQAHDLHGRVLKVGSDYYQIDGGTAVPVADHGTAVDDGVTFDDDLNATDDMVVIDLMDGDRVRSYEELRAEVDTYIAPPMPGVIAADAGGNYGASIRSNLQGSKAVNTIRPVVNHNPTRSTMAGVKQAGEYTDQLLPVFDLREALLNQNRQFYQEWKWPWLWPIPTDAMVSFLVALALKGHEKVLIVPYDAYQHSSAATEGTGFSVQLDATGQWRAAMDDALTRRAKGILSHLYQLPGMHWNSDSSWASNGADYAPFGLTYKPKMWEDYWWWEGIIARQTAGPDQYGWAHGAGGDSNNDMTGKSLRILSNQTLFLPSLLGTKEAAFKNYRALVFPVDPVRKVFEHRDRKEEVYTRTFTKKATDAPTQALTHAANGKALFYTAWDDTNSVCTADVPAGTADADALTDADFRSCLRLVFVDALTDSDVRHGTDVTESKKVYYAVLDPLNWTADSCPSVAGLSYLRTVMLEQRVESLGMLSEVHKRDNWVLMGGTQHNQLRAALCMQFADNVSVTSRRRQCIEKFDLDYDEVEQACVPLGEREPVEVDVETLVPLQESTGDFVVLVDPDDPTTQKAAGTATAVTDTFRYVRIGRACVNMDNWDPVNHVIFDYPEMATDPGTRSRVAEVVCAKAGVATPCGRLESREPDGSCAPRSAGACTAADAEPVNIASEEWTLLYDDVRGACQFNPYSANPDVLRAEGTNRHYLVLPKVGNTVRVAEIDPAECYNMVYDISSVSVTDVFDDVVGTMDEVRTMASEPAAKAKYELVCGHALGEHRHTVPDWAVTKYAPTAAAPALPPREAPAPSTGGGGGWGGGSSGAGTGAGTGGGGTTWAPEATADDDYADDYAADGDAEEEEATEGYGACFSTDNLMAGITWNPDEGRCVKQTVGEDGTSADLVGLGLAAAGLVVLLMGAGGSSA